MLFSILTPILERIMAMGGIVMAMALLSTLMINLTLNSWFSLILFLIYITGLLVMFGYLLAITPNVRFVGLRKFSSLFILVFVLTIMSVIKTVHRPDNKNKFDIEVVVMYKGINLIVYWIIAVVLLIALILVVAICFKSPSPLRPFTKVEL